MPPSCITNNLPLTTFHSYPNPIPPVHRSLKRMITSSMCYVPSSGNVRISLDGVGGREEFEVEALGGSGRVGRGGEIG